MYKILGTIYTSRIVTIVDISISPLYSPLPLLSLSAYDFIAPRRRRRRRNQRKRRVYSLAMQVVFCDTVLQLFPLLFNLLQTFSQHHVQLTSISHRKIPFQLLCDFRETNLRTRPTILDGLKLGFSDLGTAMVIHFGAEQAGVFFVYVDTLQLTTKVGVGAGTFPLRRRQAIQDSHPRLP
jgi:hypothetical protein